MTASLMISYLPRCTLAASSECCLVTTTNFRAMTGLAAGSVRKRGSAAGRELRPGKAGFATLSKEKFSESFDINYPICNCMTWVALVT